MPTNPPPGYPRISPYLNYEDTGAMMDWLARAFGLVERHSQRGPDGQVIHAEMALEDGLVMMGSPGGDFRNPKRLGQVTQSLYVYIVRLGNALCPRSGSGRRDHRGTRGPTLR